MFQKHNFRRTKRASIYLDKLLWKPKSFGRFPDNPAFSPTLNFWTEREGNPSGTWKMHFWGNKRKLGERKWTPNLWNGGEKKSKSENFSWATRNFSQPWSWHLLTFEFSPCYWDLPGKKYAGSLFMSLWTPVSSKVFHCVSNPMFCLKRGLDL